MRDIHFKNMHVKKLTPYILVLLFLLLTQNPLLSFSKPSITRYNNTENIIYAYPGQSIYGVEPNDEEAAKVMKERPELIKPGETLTFSLPLIWLFKDDVRMGIGWLVGSRYEAAAKSGDRHKPLESLNLLESVLYS